MILPDEYISKASKAMHDVGGSHDAERLVLAAERRHRGEIDDAEFRSVVAELSA